LIFIAFNWLDGYLDFTSNNYIRDARFGIYLLLPLAFLKFVIDFYLIYIKHSHVEITNEGILDKTSPLNENFYAWSDIVNVEVISGLLCDGLKVIYKKNMISENSLFTTNDAIVIKELSISGNEASRLKLVLKKHALIEHVQNNT